MVGINTNIAALSAQANIGSASGSASSSIARLSSGSRIVKASDDVSALAVGTSLKTQVTSLKAALGNASQGTSLLQVADGALSQINDILQRQKAIASQAGSGSLTDTDRGFLNQEFQALTQQIDQIAGSTAFNGVNLLNGGLGTTTSLLTTSAAAANYKPTTATLSAASTAVASTNPIQAFNIQTGASLATVGAAGTMSIVQSDGTTLVTTGFDSENSALVGQFSGFKFSNVVYGVGVLGSATLTATINGVDFTGSVKGTDTKATLHNGSTYISIGTGTLAFTNAAATELSSTTLSDGFKNTVIQDTSIVQGVNFDGTRLKGAIGSANYGTAATRLSSANAAISNFTYAGSLGAADTNILTVQVNGQTFTASSVKDKIVAGNIVFTSQDRQTLIVDLTGLAAADSITNIRTGAQDQSDFISALNQGFSRAGGGLNFSVGSTSSDNVGVSISSVSSTNLYHGAALSVNTAANAAAASSVIDQALNTVSSVRSTVGALESRFNFISANLQTSIQNQDAARGSLLDTDVAAESTAYATAQVQLQAGIAVLAQANQLPQNLLKLIA